MIRGLKTNRLEGISSPITEVLSVKAELLKEDNKMIDTQIFNKIKSVFPKAVFIESDEYLIKNNIAS